MTIDPNTGAGTLIGPYHPVSGSTMADITITSDSILYGWYEGQDDLFTIQKSDALIAKVGESGISTFGSGLAANSANILYYAGDGASGVLRTVDRFTGQPTTVATLSGALIPNAAINALAFNSSDVLYGANGADGGSLSHLVIINTSTGVVTDGGQTVNRLDAIAFGYRRSRPTPRSARTPRGLSFWAAPYPIRPRSRTDSIRPARSPSSCMDLTMPPVATR